ncbi:MAG: SulP family inorganic anion transporter [Planctomycetota bacterium]
MKFFANLRADLPASVVVFFVAVPLCLGIALASDAPPLAGLIAGIIGGIVVGSLSGSPLGVSGPAAGLAVIVAGAIEELGSFETFLAAVVVAGAFQITLGLLRGGVVGYFFPSSVIKGMLTGIGVVITLKQIPHAVGHDKDPEGDTAFVQPTNDENTLSSIGNMFEDFAPGAVIVSVVCLAILILWEVVLKKRSKVFQIVPGPLVAVAFGIGFQLYAKRFAEKLALEPSHLVQVPIFESIGTLTSQLSHPTLSAFGVGAVWITGITMGLVASLETLLCVEATDKIDPLGRTTPTNRELLAQGAGNVASGLIGGLPVTQVIVRSSANIQSGGRTKASAIMHGFFLLGAVLLIPTVMNEIPLAALAAVLLVVGYKLARPEIFVQMFRQGGGQFIPFIITVLGIVFTDLLIGIALGMIVAIFIILRSQYLNSHFLHIDRENEDGTSEVRMRLAEEVTFLNKGALQRELDGIADGSKLVLDARETTRIDHDALEIIAEFERSAPRRSIKVERLGMFVASATPRPVSDTDRSTDRAGERPGPAL